MNTSDENLRHAIYFDGIYKKSEVWINGHYLGIRPFGFIPIHYDLIPYLKAEGNELVVKAARPNFADARYYTGTGMYRNVYLIASNPIYFAQWGVFFQTRQIKKDLAKAKVEVEIEQHFDVVSNLSLKGVIKNREGKNNAEGSKKIEGRKGTGIKGELDF